MLLQFNFYTPHPSTSSLPHPSREKKKISPRPEEICKIDRKELEEDLSGHTKSLLGPLFKIISVDGKSVEDTRNFPPSPERHYRHSGWGYLKVWYQLYDVKDAFPNIRVFELRLPEFKKKNEK